ncbi:carbohydrate ABC transporter permease [Paenibacillus qinlingensis]|uniref:carbohydrate ABC transporter permease n=1 Tax=Paenibacillus qinlingensis TaxID=1837343 RepID=UPI00156581C4|nr:carbohydrate ABC transporter permease [Paenibacillus qinlingensis]NQX61089.1 carbohydrate ABC transporter permease [Paenibacillus qinlingensis]
MKQRITVFSIFNLMLMLGVVVVTLYPFLYMLAVSLSDSTYVMKGSVTWYPKGLNLAMYELVLKDPRIMKGFLNTFAYTVLGTLISLTITAFGAYAITKKEMMFAKGFTLMVVITLFFSGGMIPTFLVVKSYGLMDTIWAMVLPNAVNSWNLLVMTSFFRGIPKEIEESGKMDGLNDIAIAIRIVFPMSKAVFTAIGLFTAVGLWNDFFTPLLYLRDVNLFPLSVVLRNIMLAGQMATEATSAQGDAIVTESLKYAVLMVATLPILLLYPFLQKYFDKGVLVGSIKG